MLKSLQIKNYALIENIYVDFGKGLNIITGETGAGKSILIGALGLLLGDRASGSIVRSGTSKAIIEGIFNVRNNKRIKVVLEKYDLDFEDELIIRREISAKGSGRNFVNDTPVNLNQIKKIGNILVDIHGQHDHQSLLKTEEQLKVLDEFGNYSNLLSQFSTIYTDFRSKLNELNELITKEDSLKQKEEFYSFQLNEINKVDPKINEDVELESELKILENSEKFLTNSKEIHSRLYDDENSVHDILVVVQKSILELLTIDSSFESKNEQLDSIIASVDDLAEFFREYYQNLDLDPDKIEQIRERLGELNLLKKKYGSSISRILEYKEKISSEIDLSANYTEIIKETKNEIEKLRVYLTDLSLKISEARKKVAVEIKKGVESELKKLGIGNSIFEVKFGKSLSESGNDNFVKIKNKKIKLHPKGIDEIEFFISTNLGEETKPLSKVASGGEISRIMLALKSILAKTDKLPLLIFDEIDTGVSGRIAQKVGRSMKSLASFHQLIAITHLPQIAGLADHHYLVEKKQVGNRVISNLRKLSGEERINEVAKLMSGEEISEVNLQSAKTLMGK